MTVPSAHASAPGEWRVAATPTSGAAERRVPAPFRLVLSTPVRGEGRVPAEALQIAAMSEARRRYKVSQFGVSVRRGVLRVTVFLLALSGASLVTTLAARNASAAPTWTASYYVESRDTGVWARYGCHLGHVDRDRPGAQNRIVVLDFGEPSLHNGVYGAFLYDGAFADRPTIAALAESFATYYYRCTEADVDSVLTLSLGTNNDGSQIANNAYQQGRAWGNLVNTVVSWAMSTGFNRQVKVHGASDMELGWNGSADTLSWLDGFDSISASAVYDYGDANSCPPLGSCANGWSQEDLYQKVAGRSSVARGLPEVYSTGQAREWSHLAGYASVYHSSTVYYTGTLAQFKACMQEGCTADNTPDEAWTALYNELQSDSRTQQSPRWSDDICYSGNNDGVCPVAEGA